jgi:hypothetical protein
MPSKEHLALKFDICTILQSAKPDETVKTAGLILSTILAALQEPSEGMIEAGCDQYEFGDQITQGEILTKEWRAMLEASPLSEES